MSTDKLWTVISGIEYQLNILKDKLKNLDEETKQSVDKAYQRGYDKGYADKTNNDEVSEELIEGVYQRGLDDAWEAARKVAFNADNGGLSIEDLEKAFDCLVPQQVFKKYTAQQTIAKLKAYEEKQKTDDEIKVGDEVIDTQSGARFCVTHFWVNNHGEKGVSGFNHECSAFQDTSDKVKKTGRHFEIDKILEAMKE